MMRFDYLHDGVPDAIDRLRNVRVSNEVKRALVACVVALLFASGTFGIERLRVAQAASIDAQAYARLTATRRELAATNLERIRIETLLDLDRRLRAIHRSGALLARRIVDIANHVPTHVWLTTIARTPSGITIDGRAEGLRAVSETIAAFTGGSTIASPSLVRANADAPSSSRALLAFELTLAERR